MAWRWGKGHPAAAAPPLAAGRGFVLGVALASALLHLDLAKLSTRRTVAWRLAVEACLLAGFLLAWQFAERPAAGLSLYVLILLGAAGMGIQSVAARQDGRPGVTPVVFTSTLTAMVIAVTGAVLGSPHRLGFAAKRQSFIFLAYGVGAVTGSFLTWRAIDAIPFLPLLATGRVLGQCLSVALAGAIFGSLGGAEAGRTLLEAKANHLGVEGEIGALQLSFLSGFHTALLVCASIAAAGIFAALIRGPEKEATWHPSCKRGKSRSAPAKTYKAKNERMAKCLGGGRTWCCRVALVLTAILASDEAESRSNITRSGS